MGVAHVGNWLASLGLSAYAPLFAEQGIDGEVLAELTEADLQSLGLPLGPRKKLLKAIAALKDAGPGATVPGAAPPPRHGAERRNLTLLFCDMVSSTTLATSLDPEELRAILHRYMDTCTSVIEEFGGYVASYHGDGLMAFFGYPQAREDAAERAVRAALSLVASVGQLMARPNVPLQARIGIATGLAVVGDLIGDGATREDAVVGQPPALAVRLQSLAPPGGIILSQATRDLVGGMFILEPLGPQILKGFDQPQPAWQVLGATAVESRFAAGRASRAAMVGRSAEMAALQECWRMAAIGNGQVVILSAEAGFGKSRLIQGLREAITGQPHDLVLLQCASYSQSSALRPVIDWIERRAGFTAADPPATRLARLDAVPGLHGAARQAVAELLGLAELPPAADQSAWRERTLAALASFFSASLDGTPRLLVFEDSHWSDTVSLELLERLIARAAGYNLMVLISTRPEARLPAISNAAVTTIALDRLGAAGTAQLIEALGAERLSPALCEQIAARAGGVPLFIEELTRSVLEGGGGTVAIPATLQDTLMARLDRLGPAKAIAQTGAVLGRQFYHRWLTSCTGAAPDHLSESLDQLMESGLLTGRGSPPDAIYTFRHALTQDAAYQSMLKTDRMRKHGEIARMLENGFQGMADEQPELIAHHYTEAGEADPAIEWWARAARRATAQAAWVEATNHLQLALGLLAGLPEGAARDERETNLRQALITPLVSMGGYSTRDSQANIDRLGVLLEHAPPRFEHVVVLYSEAMRLLERSDLARTEMVAKQTLHIAQRCGVPNAPFLAQRVLGYSAILSGNFIMAEHWFGASHRDYNPEINRAIRPGSAIDPLASMNAQDMLLLTHQGRFAAAAARGAFARAEAEAFGSPTTTAYVLAHFGLVCAITGDTASAGPIISALQESVERASWLRPHVECLAGWLAARNGDLEAGLAQIKEGLDISAGFRSKMWQPLYTLAAADALVVHGAHTQALAKLDECEHLAATLGQNYVLAELHRLRAEVFAATGNDRVEPELYTALQIARQQGTRFYELRASSSLAARWRANGEIDRATALLTPLLAGFEDAPDQADLAYARSLLEPVTVK